MILLYGSKAKKMASKILPYEECPSCKQKGNLELTLYRSYIHVYGIPVLNEGKQTEVDCLSCECCIKPAYKPFFLKKSKYSEKIADEIREIKKYNKQSLWQLAWTSLLTIIFLIFLTVELIKNDAIKYLVSTDKENIALMQNPQVVDIYKVGGKDGFFDKVRELGLDAAQGIFNR